MNSDLQVESLMFHAMNLEFPPSTERPSLPAMDCSSKFVGHQVMFDVEDTISELTGGSSHEDNRFTFYDLHEDFMTAGLLDTYPQFVPENTSEDQPQEYATLMMPPSQPIQIPAVQTSLPQDTWDFFLPHYAQGHIPSAPEFTMRSESIIQGLVPPHFMNYTHMCLDMAHLPPMESFSSNDTSSSLSSVPGQRFLGVIPGSLAQGDFMASISPGILSSSVPERPFLGFKVQGRQGLSSSLPSGFGSRTTLSSSFKREFDSKLLTGPNQDGGDMDVDPKRPDISVFVVESDDESPVYKKGTRRGVKSKDIDKPKAPKLVLKCTNTGCQTTCSSYPSLTRHQESHKWRGRYAPVKCEACQSSLSNEFSVQRHISRSTPNSRCKRMRVYSIMRSETEIENTVRFYPDRGHGKKTVPVNLEHMKRSYWNAARQ
ncbi:hypothetical protein BG003_000675 [Podila horticola]|nr:hypothetical protein BG003_000675 [Podila horticola]